MTMSAYGKGNIDFETYKNNERVESTIYNVLYVPDSMYNLFSVKYAGKRGIYYEITHNPTRCV